jgi:hypothetical protein
VSEQFDALVVPGPDGGLYSIPSDQLEQYRLSEEERQSITTPDGDDVLGHAGITRAVASAVDDDTFQYSYPTMTTRTGRTVKVALPVISTGLL